MMTPMVRMHVGPKQKVHSFLCGWYFSQISSREGDSRRVVALTVGGWECCIRFIMHSGAVKMFFSGNEHEQPKP